MLFLAPEMSESVAVEGGGLLGGVCSAFVCPCLVEVDFFGVVVASGGVNPGLVAGVRGVLACVRRTLVGTGCELLEGGPPERSFVHRVDLARRPREVHSRFLRPGFRAIPYSRIRLDDGTVRESLKREGFGVRLSGKRVVVCAGAGGVGKTTVSAR